MFQYTFRSLMIIVLIAVSNHAARAAMVQTDTMSMHLSDAEVIARDASHSGNNAAALVSEPTRLGGGDPGQWWFSPVRGLGFRADDPNRADAEWNMSVDGNGAGTYQITLVNVDGTESLARDIDLYLVGNSGNILISDLNGKGDFDVLFTVTAADIVGGNLRFRVELGEHADDLLPSSRPNATIGDIGDFRPGAATLYFDLVPEPASLGLLALGGLAMLTRRRA